MIESHIRVLPYEPSALPPVDTNEVWRYSGCREIPTDEAMLKLMDEVLAECSRSARGQVVYGRYKDFPFETSSKGLSELLSGCSEVIIFAATVGLDFDRLVGRYKRVSPSRALLIGALGAERVEALCDTFCSTFKGATTRFSPGYGDLDISAQKEIFNLLRVEEKIGISLNESLLMTPTKSVTAIFGIKEGAEPLKGHDCSKCGLKECEFRRQS